MATKPKTQPEVKPEDGAETTFAERLQAQIAHVESVLEDFAEEEVHDLSNAVYHAYSRLHEVLTEVLARQ